MRLPSHSYDTLDLVRNMSIPADGPEQVITADEYLHPQAAASRHQRGLTAAHGPYHINGALELVCHSLASAVDVAGRVNELTCLQ